MVTTFRDLKKFVDTLYNEDVADYPIRILIPNPTIEKGVWNDIHCDCYFNWQFWYNNWRNPKEGGEIQVSLQFHDDTPPWEMFKEKWNQVMKS